MTNSQLVEIVLIVDRSGSMQGIARDMEGAIERYLEDQKQQPGSTRVTYARFDDTYELVFANKPISDTPAIKIEARNMTALLDAMGRTINSVGVRLAATDEAERPGQVLVVVVTDGFENASREFNREQVFALVTHQQENYGWAFTFIGANQDAIATGRTLGVPVTNSLTYAPTRGSSQAAFHTLSAATTNLRSYVGATGQSAGASYDFYADESQDVTDAK